MKPRKFDALRDQETVFCFLVNCSVVGDKVQCGAAWFRGGISGELKLFDIYNSEVLKIFIPPQIQNIATFAVLTPVAPLDYLELEIIN